MKEGEGFISPCNEKKLDLRSGNPRNVAIFVQEMTDDPLHPCCMIESSCKVFYSILRDRYTVIVNRS